MERPSEKWLSQYKNTLVPEQFIEISYESTDPGVQEDASASSGTQAVFSTLDTITDDEKTIKKYATGELNFHVLDGSFRLISSKKPPTDAGYVSENFVSDEYHPKITLSFSSVRTKVLPGIQIVWSKAVSEYAKAFSVTSYNGVDVVDRVVVQDNDSVETTVEHDFSKYDSIVIEILDWCVPNRRARIEYILLGIKIVFAKKDVISFTHISSRDPISGQLSADGIDFSVDNSQKKWDVLNPKGRFRYLYDRQPVSVRYGMQIGEDIEWISGGNFFLSEWSVPANGIEATFSARDALVFLTGTVYTGRKTGTLYEVCKDALEFLPESVPYFISESLKEYPVDISEQTGSYKNSDILQLAANAAGMALYQKRSGEIRIEPVEMASADEENIVKIDVINNYQWPEITFSPAVRDVSTQINGKEYVYPEQSSVDGVTQTLSNDLLNSTILKKSENALTKSYSSLSHRKKLSLSYRASPHLDAFDIVRVSNNFGYETKIFTTEIKYEFSGAFKGTVSGYALTDVSSIQLSPQTISLLYGQTKKLTASIFPESSENPTIYWKSLPEGFVELHVVQNTSGISVCEVKYLKKGSASVTAYVGGVESTTIVTNDSPVLTLNKTSVSIGWGETVKVKAVFSPANYSDPEIKWNVPSGIVAYSIEKTGVGESEITLKWNKKGTGTLTAHVAEESSSCAITTKVATLDTIPEGTIVKIKESNVPTEFVLAQHNYDTAHNPAGYVLFVRRYSTSYTSNYATSETMCINGYYKNSVYIGGELDTWLNGTYLSRLDSKVRAKILSTSILCTNIVESRDDDSNTILLYPQSVEQRKCFVLSATEYVGTGYNYVSNGYVKAEGKQIPNAGRIAYENTLGKTYYVWTRSPQLKRFNDGADPDYEGRLVWVAEGVASINAQGTRYDAIILSASGRTANQYISQAPAFTLPKSLEIDADGNLIV